VQSLSALDKTFLQTNTDKKTRNSVDYLESHYN